MPPLSYDLTEPPSLLQTAIAYLNRASSMSFIFFLSNPFPSIFRQIPKIYLRNRLPSLLFQVDATILMLKQVSHFLFEHVFRASGEDAVIFWTQVARIHLMKLIDCPLCRFDAAILFSLKQVPKPILWDKSSTCLLSSLFKCTGPRPQAPIWIHSPQAHSPPRPEPKFTASQAPT